MNSNSYTVKHNRIKDFLNKNKADAIVFISTQNTFWISNTKTSDGIVLVTPSKIFLLVDLREYEYCKKYVQYCEVVLFKKIDDFKKIINDLNIKTLLFEKDYLTLKQKEQYLDSLKTVNSIPVDTISLRSIKTIDEIKVLQQSANIAVNAIEDVKKWIKVGMTEIEVAQHIHSYMINQGASNISFELIVAFGKNTAIPHHQPTNTRLENNQMVTCDIGCIYLGYCSDITRTFFVGTPSCEEQEMYDLVLSAQKIGLENVKSQIYTNQLDEIVRTYIAKNKKWGNLFTHSLGHGVGIEIHELPFVSQRTNTILEENMVITIEPGVYQPGFNGVRIEDTVVVTENGCINLTAKASKKFTI